MALIDPNMPPSNQRENMAFIDLNRLSKEAEEALLEEEHPVLKNNEADLYSRVDISDSSYESDTVVFTGESTLDLLPHGQRRKHAPIPSSVKRNQKPQWLPIGWWVDYRVRRGSNVNKMFIYKNYVEPVTGLKFRSKKEVERHLHPETAIEIRKAHAANPKHSQFKEIIWGRKRRRSGVRVTRKLGWVCRRRRLL